MRSTRLVEVPFELVAAELAAAPFTARSALASALTEISADLAAPSDRFWREVEGRITQSFPSYSVDEVTSLRDWLWFRERTFDRRHYVKRRGQRDEEVLTLTEYIRQLSSEVLTFAGNAFRPKMPPWASESGHVSDSLDDSRARHFWRWVTFTMPPDILMAAHPNQGRGVSRVETVSSILSRILADRGFVEPHVHLGAAMDFQLTWIATLHAVARPEVIQRDSFVSPGADWRDGRDLATWVLCGAICRYMLASFLRRVLEDDPADWGVATETLFERELRSHMGMAMRKTADGGKFEAVFAMHYNPVAMRLIVKSIDCLFRGSIDDLWSGGTVIFKQLQHAYDYITRITIRWGTFPEHYEDSMNADPIGAFFPARGLGERSSEMEWFNAALAYMESERGHRDAFFAKLFWQTVRVRCGLYRHLVQRPMIPGLQWFMRFYSRLRPARAPLSAKLLVESAASICGESLGLSSLEVRISAYDDLQGNERALRQIFEAFEERSRRAAQKKYLNLISAELGSGSEVMPFGQPGGSLDRLRRDARENILPSKRVRTSDIEFGVIVHFQRDRGGGSRLGVSKARGLDSHADPSAKLNHGMRYSNFYILERQKALALAQLIARYPRSLYYLRGLDIAADELGVPTWVMKPLVRYVRDVSRHASAHLHEHLDEAVPPLRTTVHVGEDFIHLLSGLRRIDEAIEHLELTQGDRLSHGIALGINARQWAESSSGVAVTRIERLFDLAWEWKFTTQKATETSANRIQFVIEQIHSLSKLIFGEFSHPTQIAEFCNLLYNETELSNIGFPSGPIEDMDRYIAERYETEKRLVDDDIRFRSYPERENRRLALQQAQRDLQVATNLSGVAATDAETFFGAFKGRWKEAHGHEAWRFLHRYLSDPATFRRGQVQMLIDPMFEADALQSLQSALRRKVSRLGLTIEINPSSNLLIGNLSDLNNHPLWRLKPPVPDAAVRDPISISIGSDDPLTFATNTPQEYQLIYDTLTLAGVSDVDARAWLESVRLAGKESRFTLPQQLPTSDLWVPMSLALDGVQRLL